MTDIAQKHSQQVRAGSMPQQDVSEGAERPRLFPALRLPAVMWLGGSWLLLGLPTLIYPFGRDQGVFAYIGERLLTGARLYVDLWDVKSPLVYWMYGLALKLANSQTIGVRLMDMILAAFTAYLVYSLAISMRRSRNPQRSRRSQSEYVGVVAGILYLLWYYLPNDYRVLANCESFITPFLVLGMLYIVRAAQEPAKSMPLWFWGGMALGATTLFKTTGLVFVLPALGAALALSAENSWRRRLFAASALVTGFVAPLLLGWLYLIRTGALEDWLYLNFTYLPSYTAVSYAGSIWADIIRPVYILGAVATIYPALITGIAVFGIGVVVRLRMMKRRGDLHSGQAMRVKYIVLAFGLVYAGVVAVQGKYLHYHFLPLLGPFSALVAVAVLDSLEDFRASLWTKSLALLTLALGLAHVWKLPERCLSLGKMIADEGYAEQYCEELSTGNYSCATSRQIGEYLRKDAEAGDRLLVWSFEPEIYFLSGLEPSSRFLFNTPFFAGSISAAWKAEFMMDLMSRPPDYVVIGEGDGLPLITGDSYSSRDRLKEVEGLSEFIQVNYEPVKTIDKFTILKRRIFGAIPHQEPTSRL